MTHLLWCDSRKEKPMPRVRRNLLHRVIFAIPVIGWMLRDVAEGDEHTMGWFALTLACSIGVAALVFGLPGLVTAMLFMTVLTLGAILLITFG